MAAMLGLSFVACGGTSSPAGGGGAGNDGGGNGGGNGITMPGASGTITIDQATGEMIIRGPVLELYAYFANGNRRTELKPFTGNMTITSPLGGRTGRIVNGQFEFDVPVPMPENLTHLTAQSFLESLDLRNSFLPAITMPPSRDFAIIRHFISEGDGRLARSASENTPLAWYDDSVHFIYVTGDIVIGISSYSVSGTIGAHQYQTVLNATTLNLQAGWNRLFMRYRETTVGGMIHVTFSFSVADPNYMRWILLDGRDGAP